MKNWFHKLYKYFTETDEGKTLVLNIGQTKFWEMGKLQLKLLIVKALKLGSFSGVQAFIINMVLEHFYDKIVEPVLKKSLRNVSYEYNKEEGIVLITKLEKAKVDKDEDSYNRTIDDVLN